MSVYLLVGMQNGENVYYNGYCMTPDKSVAFPFICYTDASMMLDHLTKEAGHVFGFLKVKHMTLLSI